MILKKRKKDHRPKYPFNAIIDQPTAKTVLILNAIDPSIGGALISGPKGSGKSLLINSFSEILPQIEVVADCVFNCSPNDPSNMCINCQKILSKGDKLDVEKIPMKIVTVPLSVTEDMIVGSINLDKIVSHGLRALQPGLMAEANQNILYIDEVNLLPDHITDNILDAAALGWNTVEREGISIQHPARFILVGTMNPEEGDLRPQILDRFGIFAETTNIEDTEKRRKILSRNEDFQRDPFEFINRYIDGLNEQRKRIERAKKFLPEIKMPDDLYTLVAETCSKLRVDGFRPDIVAVKAARALAAFKGKKTIDREDIIRALEISLGHRTRGSGLTPPPKKKEIRKALRKAESKGKMSINLDIPKISRLLVIPRKIIDDYLKQALKNFALNSIIFLLLIISLVYLLDYIRIDLIGKLASLPLRILEIFSAALIAYLFTRLIRKSKKTEEVTLGLLEQSDMSIETSGRLPEPRKRGVDVGGGGIQAKVKYIGEDTANLSYGPKILQSIESLQKRPRLEKREIIKKSRREGGYNGGRRTKVISSSSRGRYAWYQIPKNRPQDIAIVPTIKVAALKQRDRKRKNLKTVIELEDIREKVREYSAPYSIIILVDMSLSMIESVENIAETIYSLHREVYRRRDRVGLIVFKGSRAYTLQHPTRNLDLVVQKLRNVGASDFTPMATGLFQAWKALKQEKIRNRDAILYLYIISDGIANVPLEKPLSPITRRRYTSEAQADAFDVARLLAKENIRIQVYNTDHSEEEAERFPVTDEDRRIRFTPTQFLMELSRVSRGKYIGLKTKPQV